MIATIKRSSEGELFINGKIITNRSSHGFFYVSIQFNKFPLIRVAKIDRSRECAKFTKVGNNIRIAFGSFAGESLGKIVSNGSQRNYGIECYLVGLGRGESLITTITTECGHRELFGISSRSDSDIIVTINTTDSHGRALGTSLSGQDRIFTTEVDLIGTNHCVLCIDLKNLDYITGIDIHLEDRGHIAHLDICPVGPCSTNVGAGEKAVGIAGKFHINLAYTAAISRGGRINGIINRIFHTNFQLRGSKSGSGRRNFDVLEICPGSIIDTNHIAGSPGSLATYKGSLGIGIAKRECKHGLLTRSDCLGLDKFCFFCTGCNCQNADSCIKE